MALLDSIWTDISTEISFVISSIFNDGFVFRSSFLSIYHGSMRSARQSCCACALCSARYMNLLFFGYFLFGKNVWPFSFLFKSIERFTNKLFIIYSNLSCICSGNHYYILLNGNTWDALLILFSLIQ